MSKEITAQYINETVTLAHNAFVTYRNVSAIKRAEFLEKIADEIEAIRQAIIAQSKQQINQLYLQSSQAATDIPPDVSEKD